MNEKILVPALGESITEATVAKWLKNKGDTIEMDEPIVELETDKVNLEVPSPINGILSEINASNGQVVKVGTELGLISQNPNQSSEKIAPKLKEKTDSNLKVKNNSPKLFNENIIKLEKNAITKQDSEEPLIIKQDSEEPLTLSNSEEPLILSNSEEPLILSNKVEEENKLSEIKNHQTLSPAVRKIVTENKIDIQNLKGSGKDGRIIKGDLIQLMGSVPKPSERKAKYGQEERIRMTRLRITIAKRLKQAQESAAMLTTFNEVDMSSIIKMRKEHQQDFQNRFGIKLGFMSFFVKASVVGLKSFPAINAEIENEDIIYKNYYNISFAVGTEKGLVVPVLKNADELSFADIEKNIKMISEKARDGKLIIDDLQGGTFTISNGGVYGSMLSTPILNTPQSGVLGMHNIVERPMVVEGEIKIRPIMYLALSYDHRIIDGKEAVSFLKTIKENLEDPRRLFLDI